MTLIEIQYLMEAQAICCHERFAQVDITTAFGADLMSDVLAFARSGCLLITGLTTPQAVRTAFALDIAAILLCRGKTPLPLAVDTARDLRIPILRTRSILFETCGILYQNGIKGCIPEICGGELYCGT